MMKREHFLSCAVAVLAGLLAGGAQAADTCAFDQMQADASSVIAPCSTRLADASLSTADRAETFYVRGRAYARTGKTPLAAQDFDVAVKLAPARSDILVSRATAELKLGRMQEGWADLTRALTVNPREGRAYRAMAQLFEGSGDLREAARLYGRALEVTPGEPYALLFRSNILAEQHQFAEAMVDASALVAIPPEVINKLGYVDEKGRMFDFHAVALTRRAKLYEEIGDHEAASKDLEAALAQQRTASTLETRAEYLLRMHRSDDALKDLDEAVRLDPDDSMAHYLRGLALAGLNRYEEGLSAFDRAAELHSKIRVTREQAGLDQLMRARMFRGLGKTDEAVRTIEAAIETSPEVKESTLLALSAGGYWTETDVSPTEAAAFSAALRACMIDKDCN